MSSGRPRTSFDLNGTVDASAFLALLTNRGGRVRELSVAQDLLPCLHGDVDLHYRNAN